MTFASSESKGIALFEQKRYTEAFDTFKKINSPTATFYRGLMFRNGLAVKRDNQKGWSLITESGQLGYVKAQLLLAEKELIYKNFEQACYWFDRAASQLNPQGVIGVINCLSSSDNPKKDSKRANFWRYVGEELRLNTKRKRNFGSWGGDNKTDEQMTAEAKQFVAAKRLEIANAVQATQIKSKSSGDNASQLEITLIQSVINGPQGTISGQIRSAHSVTSVSVDGQPTRINEQGIFKATLYIPPEGKTLFVEATDASGAASSLNITLNRNHQLDRAQLEYETLNPLGAPVAENPTALALIIGIDQYARTDARALFADRDAKMFADYASQKLGVPRDRIKTLINQQADEAGILLSIQDWLIRANSPRQSDIFVFFAGHGLSSDDGQDIFLLPHDGSPRLLSRTALKRSELFDTLASVSPKSVTIFLDTCYSGTTRGPEMLIATRPISLKVAEKSIPDNFTLISAASGSETAKPLNEAEHGLFSYFLMKGMEGPADVNRDGNITVGELYAFTKKQVSKESAGQQTPQLSGDPSRILIRLQ